MSEQHTKSLQNKKNPPYLTTERIEKLANHY